MKKNLSMLSIVVRSSIYKIMGILLGMGVLQTVLFYQAFRSLHTEPIGSSWYSLELFEEVLQDAQVHYIFLAAFILICVTLIWAESERRGSKTFYLYDRLAVDFKSRFLSWSIYNVLCLLMLFAVQVLLVFGLGVIYQLLADPDFVLRPMYFSAFYKSRFLHCLLPMEEWLKWVRNVLMILAVGMEIADCSCRGRKLYSAAMLICYLAVGFVQDIASYWQDWLCILVCGVVFAANGYKLYLQSEED